MLKKGTKKRVDEKTPQKEKSKNLNVKTEDRDSSGLVEAELPVRHAPQYFINHSICSLWEQELEGWKKKSD